MPVLQRVGQCGHWRQAGVNVWSFYRNPEPAMPWVLLLPPREGSTDTFVDACTPGWRPEARLTPGGGRSQASRAALRQS
jgi:hypothetical protein